MPWTGVWFLALLAIFLIARPLGLAIGLDEKLVFAGCCVVLGIAAFAVWWRLRAVWRISPDFGPREHDTGERVTLMASEAMLARVGHPSTDGFEPRIFRVWSAERGPRWLRWTIGVLAFLGTLLAISLVRGRGTLAWWGSGSSMPSFIDIQAAISAGYVPTMLLWPTYFRIVPGRLDILEFTLLGTKVDRVRKVNLREGRIVANAATGTLLIMLESGEYLGVPYAGLPPRRAEFAKSIAEAAICSREAPELPDDALLG